MHSDCYWRDLLTFSWDFKRFTASSRSKSGSVAPMPGGRPLAFAWKVRDNQRHWWHRRTLEFFRFETKVALGRSYVRLVGDVNSAVRQGVHDPHSDGSAEEFPEAIGRNRPREDQRVASANLVNRLDQRRPAGQKDRDLTFL